MSFEKTRAVADAVLFEGYALYPYRRSSKKNLARWQFGVVAPRDFSEADGGDPWWVQTECLAIAEYGAHVSGRLRFLRLRRRRIADEHGRARESIDAGGKLLVAWDEGEVQEIAFSLGVPDHEERAVRFELPGDTVEARIGGACVEHRRHPLAGVIRVSAERVPGERPCARLRVRVENHTTWPRGTSRDEAMIASMLGAHVLLAIDRGELVSQIDPPEWAAEAAAACKNVRLFPVLAGDKARRDAMLAAPIILYDHPEIAPESPGDLFDATEIDEILTLRTRMLTDDEKREARATDARVAALIDRVDAMSGDDLSRLHGTFREAPRPRAQLSPGDRVRLRPGARRTDAQDMFLDGMIATVRAAMHDVDGRACFAVTIDDDPAADLHLARGLFHYFYIDEIEPLTSS